MKFARQEPAREFQCGRDGWVTLRDCGTLELEAGELARFRTVRNFSYCLLRQPWGYVVPSPLNYISTVQEFVPLIAGEDAPKSHLLFIDNSLWDQFDAYRAREGIRIIARFSGGPVKGREGSNSEVWGDSEIPMHDFVLEPDEQVTLVSSSGTEFDVVRKSWGFYGTPSFGLRMPRFKLRPILFLSGDGTQYFAAVERGWEAEFKLALNSRDIQTSFWLDDGDELRALGGRH